MGEQPGNGCGSFLKFMRCSQKAPSRGRMCSEPAPLTPAGRHGERPTPPSSCPSCSPPWVSCPRGDEARPPLPATTVSVQPSPPCKVCSSHTPGFLCLRLLAASSRDPHMKPRLLDVPCPPPAPEATDLINIPTRSPDAFPGGLCGVTSLRSAGCLCLSSHQPWTRPRRGHVGVSSLHPKDGPTGDKQQMPLAQMRGYKAHSLPPIKCSM